MSSPVTDYSPQAVFDATVRHLAQQGGPSVVKTSESWSCMYRGPHGRRCAVGFWIPNERYSYRMEKTAVLGGLSSSAIQAALPEPMRTRRILNLLEKLQLVHDYEGNWRGGAWNTERMSVALRDLAYTKKLRVGVIKECFSNG